MAQPPEAEALSAELRRAYELAWDEIVAEQELIAEAPEQFRRRARLRELQAMVEDRMGTLDDQARVWMTDQYPLVYRMGGEHMGGLLDEPFRWTSADQAAITTLAQDTFDDLLAATANVLDSTKDLVRRLARERALVGRIAGETATQSAARLRRLLNQHGIHAVTYRDGSRHGLAEYADVVMRTKTAVAYNAGALNLGNRAGVRFYEVFDGAGCGWSSHSDPDRANGTIRSADECASFVIAHPRCLRSFGPRPDIADEQALAEARLSVR